MVARPSTGIPARLRKFLMTVAAVGASFRNKFVKLDGLSGPGQVEPTARVPIYGFAVARLMSNHTYLEKR